MALRWERPMWFRRRQTAAWRVCCLSRIFSAARSVAESPPISFSAALLLLPLDLRWLPNRDRLRQLQLFVSPLWDVRLRLAPQSPAMRQPRFHLELGEIGRAHV